MTSLPRTTESKIYAARFLAQLLWGLGICFDASAISSPPQCNVFAPPYAEMRVAVIPQLPTSNQLVTVCYLGWQFSDYAAIQIDGNHIIVTIYDNLFSYSPNPWIVLGQEIGPLAPGDYKVDVILTAFLPVPQYPIPVASAVPLHVTSVPATTEWAVEYFNRTLNHYFVTSLPAEMQALDLGVFVGWQRTGYSFRVNSKADDAAVCRYYMPPGQGDSHFYSASASECNEVATKFPSFIQETPSLFTVLLPNPVTGECGANHAPVYRMWNNRADSNHRYITDPELRSQMIKLGYVPEGYGPTGVAMCAAK